MAKLLLSKRARKKHQKVSLWAEVASIEETIATGRSWQNMTPEIISRDNLPQKKKLL